MQSMESISIISMPNILSLSCDKCSITKIQLNRLVNPENYSKNKHYLLCKKCLGEINVCSKSKCKKTFLLNDSDLKNTKYIFLSNQYQFYIYDDIIKIIDQKYGSLDNLEKIIHSNKHKSNQIIKKKELKKNEREHKLKELFQSNKLEYKNYGDCYSYVHYGKPDIEIVLENELNRIKTINNRRIQLTNELRKIDIPLDESLESCYEYIYNLNTKDLSEIVRCIEIEHFLKYKTNYDELKKSYSSNQAKELALRKYTKDKKLPKIIYHYDHKMSFE